MIIDNKLAYGIYLLLCESEDAISDVLGDSKILKLNLASPDAYKVPAYFQEHKLKRLQSSVASHSDHPNQLLAAAIAILEEADALVIGTAGLAKDSLVSIINELFKYKFKKQVFLVHPYLDKGVKVLNITPTNIEEVAAML